MDNQHQRLTTRDHPLAYRRDADEIRSLVEQAKRMQADAVADALYALWRRLAAVATPVISAARSWRQRRDTERRLMALSDRALADIGFAREDIPLIARGKDRSQHDAAALGWGHGLRARLEATRAAHHEWRRIRRELAAYDDRELNELGISRRDIPAIASGYGNPSPA